MALTFVPILAQVLAIGVGDRTELRYRTELEPDAREDAWEVETRPYTNLELSGKRASIGVGYSPSFIYAPLEDDPELTLLHRASAQIRLELRSRHTSVTFEERADYIDENLSLQALSPPRVDVASPPSDMMPGGGGGGAMGGAGPDASSGADASAQARERASRETLRSGTVRSAVFVSHQASRKTTLGGSVGYGLTGGLDTPSREVYPIQYGPDAELSLSYLASRRDTLVTSADGLLTLTPAGERALRVGVQQGVRHRFNKRTTGDVRAGLAYTRTESIDAPAFDDLYLTGGVGLEYWRFLEGGILTLSLASEVSPQVDQSTVRFDPRVQSSARALYTRRRLTAFADATSAISLEPDSPQALNSLGAVIGVAHHTTTRLLLYSYADGDYSGRPSGAQQLNSLGVGCGAVYDLGAGFSAETGARGAYQRFEAEQIVPASFAALVALSWNAALAGAPEPATGASLAPAGAKP